MKEIASLSNASLDWKILRLIIQVAAYRPDIYYGTLRLDFDVVQSSNSVCDICWGFFIVTWE
jgi:hypothetical protein